MKKCLSCLVLAAALLLPATVSAHDFWVDGFFFNKNGFQATLTFRGDTESSYENEYKGDIVIPSTVIYEGDTYTVTAIGNKAFGNNTLVTSVTIPSTVTRIGDEAFYGCTGLTNFEIPSTITSVGSYLFYGCKGLKSVTIPTSLTSISQAMFYYCPALTSIDIPSSITSIGSYAFSYCTSLTKAVIPNSVTSVGRNAFACCNKLVEATIGNSVAEMGNQVFFLDYALNSVTCLNPKAITVPEEAFSTYSTATLYVPAGSYESYAQTSDWHLFSKIVELSEPSTVGDLNGDGKVDVADINILIDIILNLDNASKYSGRADVNKDNMVDVADINAVIDIILAQ